MKYLIRVVWREGGEIKSLAKETVYRINAEYIFKNYSQMMHLPCIDIIRVSLYEDGHEIERRIKENGSKIRN